MLFSLAKGITICKNRLVCTNFKREIRHVCCLLAGCRTSYTVSWSITYSFSPTPTVGDGALQVLQGFCCPATSQMMLAQRQGSKGVFQTICWSPTEHQVYQLQLCIGLFTNHPNLFVKGLFLMFCSRQHTEAILNKQRSVDSIFMKLHYLHYVKVWLLFMLRVGLPKL